MREEQEEVKVVERSENTKKKKNSFSPTDS